MDWLKRVAASHWWDVSYLFAFVPCLAVAVWAQIRVFVAFRKYGKKTPHRSIEAKSLAKKIMSYYGLKNIPVQRIEGDHTNHYDPREQILFLSTTVYGERSFGALGIAAHEAGHAVQYNRTRSGLFLRLRNLFLILTNFLSNIAIPIYLIGFFTWHRILMSVGAWTFSGLVIFHLLTLPVELNANRKAMKVIQHEKIVKKDERPIIHSILTACSIYYLSSSLTAILHLVRILVLSHRDID